MCWACDRNGRPISVARKGCSLRAVILNRSDLPPPHLLPGDIQQCPETFLVILTGQVIILSGSGLRVEDIDIYNVQDSALQQGFISSKMWIWLKWRNSALKGWSLDSEE